MWKFKFSAWAVILIMTALSFSACDDDDNDTYVPPSSITEREATSIGSSKWLLI